MKIVGAIFGSVCVFGLGYAIGRIMTKKRTKSCGNLRLDDYEKDEPIKMFLEIEDFDSLTSSEFVTLKVIKKNYITHKN